MDHREEERYRRGNSIGGEGGGKHVNLAPLFSSPLCPFPDSDWLLRSTKDVKVRCFFGVMNNSGNEGEDILEALLLLEWKMMMGVKRGGETKGRGRGPKLPLTELSSDCLTHRREGGDTTAEKGSSIDL